MNLDEIARAAATFSIDPDEARILAAACIIAGSYALDGSTPTENPFEALVGSLEEPPGKQLMSLLGSLLEGYAAFFEAAGMAAFLHDNFAIKPNYRVEYFLTGLREHGTGYRFPFREGEATDVP